MTAFDEPTHEELQIHRDELARRIVERAATVADLVLTREPSRVLTLTVEAGLLREQCRQWRGVTKQLTRGDA